MAKARLDELVVRRGLAASRNEAKALSCPERCAEGVHRLEKPGLKVDDDIELIVEPGKRFLSVAVAKNLRVILRRSISHSRA